MITWLSLSVILFRRLTMQLEQKCFTKNVVFIFLIWALQWTRSYKLARIINQLKHGTVSLLPKADRRITRLEPGFTVAQWQHQTLGEPVTGQPGRREKEETFFALSSRATPSMPRGSAAISSPENARSLTDIRQPQIALDHPHAPQMDLRARGSWRAATAWPPARPKSTLTARSTANARSSRRAGWTWPGTSTARSTWTSARAALKCARRSSPSSAWPGRTCTRPRPFRSRAARCSSAAAPTAAGCTTPILKRRNATSRTPAC